MSAAPHTITPSPVEPVLAPVPPPAKQAPPSGKRPWLIWLIVAAVVVGGFLIYQNRASDQAAAAKGAPAATVRTATAKLGALARSVRVTGQTVALRFSNITAPALKGPEQREMVLTSVTPGGTAVKKGQMIARIDAQSLADHIDDLGETIAAADADVRKRGAEQSIEMENLQQSLRLAKSNWDKSRLEYGAAEVRTDVERQLLKLTLDEAEATFQQQGSDIAQKKLSHQAELNILKITKERHVRHRDRHANDLKAFTIFAAMDGLAVMSPVWRGSEMGQFQVGDRLFPGQPFMKVVDPDSMEVEGTVNQAETSEFRIGQTARINLDAFPGLQFTGTLHSIGALASGGWMQNNYIRRVPVRVKIQGNDPKLIPDLSASADVLLERSGSQVTVPVNAVRYRDGRKTVEIRDAAGTFVSRSVQTGVSNGVDVSVTSGLQAGDVVRVL